MRGVTERPAEALMGGFVESMGDYSSNLGDSPRCLGASSHHDRFRLAAPRTLCSNCYLCWERLYKEVRFLDPYRHGSGGRRGAVWASPDANYDFHK